MQKLLLLSLALLLSAPVFAADASSVHAEKGDGLRRDGRLEEALKEYKEALRLRGGLPERAPAPRAENALLASITRHKEAVRLRLDAADTRG